jgi:hypothetical protein
MSNKDLHKKLMAMIDTLEFLIIDSPKDMCTHRNTEEHITDAITSVNDAIGSLSRALDEILE